MAAKLAPPESTCDPSRLARQILRESRDDWAELLFPFGKAGLRWSRRIFWGYWTTYFVAAFAVGSPYQSPMLDALAIPGATMIVGFLFLVFAVALRLLWRG